MYCCKYGHSQAVQLSSYDCSFYRGLTPLREVICSCMLHLYGLFASAALSGLKPAPATPFSPVSRSLLANSTSK